MFILLYSSFTTVIYSLLFTQCIALNNQWPKAHIRLASAYIALGGHSNHACQSLQRAISLDRTNQVARDMLIKEMRGRGTNERGNNGSSSNSTDGGDSSTHTPEEEEETSHQSQQPEQQSSSHRSNESSPDGIDVDDIDPPSGYNFHSISERVQHYFTKSVIWYQNQSEDMQTILKISFAFLLLYIALGGRFGLEYAFQKQRRGNYGNANAYERYNGYSTKYGSRNSDRYGYASESSSSSTQSRGGNSNRAQRQTESSGYNDRTNPQNNQYYSRHSQSDDDGQYYEPQQTRSTRRSSSTYHMPNLFDGSFSSMTILFIIGTICHRFGVNPFQIFWLLQAMQRGGGRHNHHGHGGYGGFGIGGGFGRRRIGRRGRW